MATVARAPRVNWDYTQHAPSYDKRADYSREAIGELLQAIGCAAGTPVAEIGAGTGKLTKELLARGLKVSAVEPNEAMRARGIRNTRGGAVAWTIGTGEQTGLADASAAAIFFGSSFNVVDQGRALREAARVLVPAGWFACLWNHRDLLDPVQRHIETIIKAHIPDYSYGSRREDPSGVIAASRLFHAARALAGRFVWELPRQDVIAAWRSHATLKRQAGSEARLARIIGEISAYLDGLPQTLAVPYATRIYFAQRSG